MSDMTIIAAVDSNWAIGYKNDVLICIPEDRKHFKKLTMGNILIVGRKTLESFPEGKPLAGRITVTITNNKEYSANDVIIVYSPEEAVQKAEEISGRTSARIFVAGGGEIYSQLKDYCTEAVITYIYHGFEYCDTYLMNLDKDDEWELTEVSERFRSGEYEYEYRTYKRSTK